MGEDWAGVTDKAVAVSACRGQLSSTPFLKPGQPCGVPAASRQGFVCSVLSFTRFSLAGNFFPICLFPIPDSYYPRIVFSVLDNSLHFILQPRDGTGSSLTSHCCFPRPAFKTLKKKKCSQELIWTLC